MVFVWVVVSSVSMLEVCFNLALGLYDIDYFSVEWLREYMGCHC